MNEKDGNGWPIIDPYDPDECIARGLLAALFGSEENLMNIMQGTLTRMKENAAGDEGDHKKRGDE